jgi:protein-L-isoaspartate(D-aspartate) O-methyltransferase
MYNSIGVVVDYLEQRDPAAAEEARRLYSCFSPWESDPAHYGRRVSTGRMQDCAVECVRVLTDLLNERLSELDADGDALFDAERNAEVVRSAEAYYREMYEGSTSTWNLRDRHMFRTLLAVMDHRGPAAKAVVWAHNSHVGDATATSMSDAGEINIGSLARQAFGERAYLIGFGTHTGEVAAADHWNGETKIKRVRPSLPESHERLFHEAESTRFFLPLREREAVRRSLSRRRLERAIGVIYRPDTERLSHYFRASLAKQFDEYIWFDKTRAVSPLPTERSDDAPEMFPFGL